MRSIKQSNKAWLACVLLACVCIALPACKKEQKTKTVITVIDDFGAVVPGALVELNAQPTGSSGNNLRFEDISGVTGNEGSVTFDFTDYIKPGQAGFAVLDVEASKDGATGNDVVEIEENKTTYKTVRIQ